MATEKAIQKLVQTFEEMYKYYHGWHFAYEHEGAFVYHQMGGDLSVFFTPDFDEPGKVAIQITDINGKTVEADEISYSPPIDAYSLFKIVRPFLDAHKE